MFNALPVIRRRPHQSKPYIFVLAKSSLNHVHAVNRNRGSVRRSYPRWTPFNVACSAALLGVPWASWGAFSEDAIGPSNWAPVLTSLNIGLLWLSSVEFRPPTRTAEVFLKPKWGVMQPNHFLRQVRTSVLLPINLVFAETAESVSALLDEARWLLRCH